MFKRKKQISLIIVVAMILSVVFAVTVSASGYTEITTAAGLDSMRKNPSGKYRLEADIDLSGYISKTNTADKGWYPIGYGSPYFTGELDGNGYTISGLWSSSKWGISYKGLFSVAMGATIKNLNIELDSRGITGGYEVGGVVGDARNGTLIENVKVSGGQIIVTGGGYAGGIVGQSYGSPTVVIKDCIVEGTYMRTSGNYAGGIVGVANKTTLVEGCKAIDVTVEAYSYAGGIAGGLKGRSTISNSEATGKVLTRASYAGGLVGVVYEGSRVESSISWANVNATHYAGGLIGTLYGKSSVFKSAAYGNATAKYYIAGGLVGEVIDATLSNTYARGDVSGTTGVGGLIGYFSGSGRSYNKSIENSYASGFVTGKGTTEYGAFNGRSGVEYKGTNYYDKETSGVKASKGTAGSPTGNASAYPQGFTTSIMMQQSNFIGWDFDSIWIIDEGNDYPVFRLGSVKPVEKAPTLEIYTESGTTIASKTIDLNGAATDERAITEVYYVITNKNYPNGQRVDLFTANPTDGITAYDIKDVMVDLAPNENSIKVVVVNKYGLTAEKTITVSYVDQSARKPVLKVHPATGVNDDKELNLEVSVYAQGSQISKVYYVITNDEHPSGKEVEVFSAANVGDELDYYKVKELVKVADGVNYVTIYASNVFGQEGSIDYVAYAFFTLPIVPDKTDSLPEAEAGEVETPVIPETETAVVPEVETAVVPEVLVPESETAGTPEVVVPEAEVSVPAVESTTETAVVEETTTSDAVAEETSSAEENSTSEAVTAVE